MARIEHPNHGFPVVGNGQWQDGRGDGADDYCHQHDKRLPSHGRNINADTCHCQYKVLIIRVDFCSGSVFYSEHPRILFYIMFLESLSQNIISLHKSPYSELSCAYWCSASGWRGKEESNPPSFSGIKAHAVFVVMRCGFGNRFFYENRKNLTR